LFQTALLGGCTPSIYRIIEAFDFFKKNGLTYISNKNNNKEDRMTKMSLRKLVLISFASFFASNCVAVTLNISGGQLLGASDVDVLGFSYDVEFANGTCFDLFDGCDGYSDFTFQDAQTASAASLALLDQVLLDDSTAAMIDFDFYANLTFTCDDSVSLVCSFFTPFASSVLTGSYAGLFVDSYIAKNYSDAKVGPSLDFSEHFGWLSSSQQYNATTYSYAIWSPAASTLNPVPAPPAIILFAFGVAGLGLAKRRLGQDRLRLNSSNPAAA
jgi:hypothetical protein